MIFMLGTPIFFKIRLVESGGRLCAFIPTKMREELDMKPGDYIMPTYIERDDNKKDDEFGDLKLVFVFYRNKSGKTYNPYRELEVDEDV